MALTQNLKKAAQMRKSERVSTSMSGKSSAKTNGRVDSWLITGGCGFIGTNLLRRLRQDGSHHTRILDNLSAGTREALASICDYEELDPRTSMFDPNPSPTDRVDLVIGDIRDADCCAQAARGIDVVVHLAANTGVSPSVKDPRLDLESNVIGTFNMLEASRAQKVRRFVFASSGAPLGECTPPIHEGLAPHPVSPYGASKLAGEGYCSAFHKTFGLETVALRFGNVYGPGSSHKSSLIAKFIRQALQNQTCVINGDGNQTRDFVYIDDLIGAIVLSASEEVAGEVFQIATSTERTVNEVVECIRAVLKEYDIAMGIDYSRPRRGDVRRNFSDTSKAAKTLRWRARTDLESGIRKTIAWFLREGRQKEVVQWAMS